MNIFWDLDGTIIDSTRRLYELFCYLTCDNSLTYDEYWNYKYQGYNQAKMLSLVGCRIDNDSFRNLWLNNIENKKWLTYDALQPHIHDVLSRIKSMGIRQYIITNRQSSESVKWELYNLGIEDCFDDFLTTEQKTTKYACISSNFLVSNSDIYIGDEAEDIHTATNLGISIISVCTDKRLEKALTDLHPTHLIYDRRKIISYLS